MRPKPIYVQNHEAMRLRITADALGGVQVDRETRGIDFPGEHWVAEFGVYLSSADLPQVIEALSTLMKSGPTPDGNA